MSKFKVGDRVKIVRNTCFHGFKDGEIIEVSKVDTLGERYRAVGFDGSKWWIKNEDAELVDDVVQTIAIRQKGLKVIAVLTDADGNYIKSAKAKCSPEDTFDFEIGKKLAVNRLLGEDVKNITPTLDGKELGETVKKLGEALSKTGARMASSLDWTSFKAGKFAVHCDTEEKAKAFLKECDEQGMKWNAGRNPNAYTNWNYYKEKTLYSTHGSSNSLCYHDINGVFQQSANLPIIDYTPSKPAVKETKSYRIVKQDKYEVGDKVKIIDKWVDGCHENPEGEMDKWLGKIMTIRVVNSDYYRMEEDKTEHLGSGWYWNNKCIEGKVVEDVPEKTAVKEVKRPAKVGEWIKIVNADHMERYRGCEEYKNGDILKVAKTNACCLDDVLAEGISEWIDKREYVVLENYQPEQSSLESKANYTTEIQIGDTVKVVNNGKCYTRYEEWFVKNAPQYLGKFAYGGMPKNGGSYKVLMKNDKDGLKYVIQEIDWPNDAVYLIDEKGIEKVK